jgi:hypothetical protein
MVENEYVYRMEHKQNTTKRARSLHEQLVIGFFAVVLFYIAIKVCFL